jgi:hypothetical protein
MLIDIKVPEEYREKSFTLKETVCVPRKFMHTLSSVQAMVIFDTKIAKGGIDDYNKIMS